MRTTLAGQEGRTVSHDAVARVARARNAPVTFRHDGHTCFSVTATVDSV